ncbi:MAG TPA: hypothetical protein VGS59_00010 [Candidatus Acidoferrales bacterium]|nr:hypothetical protein [Candidatus Acidoferrales bacterium]
MTSETLKLDNQGVENAYRNMGYSRMLKKLAFVGLAILSAFTFATVAAPGAKTKLTAIPEWSNARQISAMELAKKISGPAQTRPVVLQVGFTTLYEGGPLTTAN